MEVWAEINQFVFSGQARALEINQLTWRSEPKLLNFVSSDLENQSVYTEVRDKIDSFVSSG